MNPGSEASAPKPRRRVKRCVGLALLALLAWGVIFCLRVMYAEPVISVDYGVQIEKLVRERQGMPDGAENGWEILKAIEEPMREATVRVRDRQPWGSETAWPDVEFIFMPERRPEYGVDRDDSIKAAIELIEEFLAEGLFEQLNRVASARYAVLPAVPDSRVLDWMFTEIGAARAICRANAARMYLAYEIDDHRERLEAFDQILALGQLCTRQYTLVWHVAGRAMYAFAIYELRREMIEKPVTAEQAAEFEATLGARLPVVDIELAFEGEHLQALDVLQAIYTDDGRGNGRLLLTQLNKLQQGGDPMTAELPKDSWLSYKAANLAGLFAVDRREQKQMVDDYYANCRRFSKLAWQERDTDPNNPDDYLDGLTTTRGFFIGIMGPSCQRALQSRDQLDLELAGTILMLRIEAHRARTGEYPASLADLDRSGDPPDRDVTLDPFTRLPFGYRRIDAAADPGKRPYLLYSLGRDLTDDGGEEARDRFDALWSDVDGAGFDFVINQPRKPPYVEDPDSSQEPPE